MGRTMLGYFEALTRGLGEKRCPAEQTTSARQYRTAVWNLLYVTLLFGLFDYIVCFASGSMT